MDLRVIQVIELAISHVHHNNICLSIPPTSREMRCNRERMLRIGVGGAAAERKPALDVR